MRKGSLLSVVMSAVLIASLFVLPWCALAAGTGTVDDPITCEILYGNDADLATWVGQNYPGGYVDKGDVEAIPCSTSGHFKAGDHTLHLHTSSSEVKVLKLTVNPLEAAISTPPTSKAYDGTTDVKANTEVTNAVPSSGGGTTKDVVSVAFAYRSVNVGGGNCIDAGLTGADCSNYVLATKSFNSEILPMIVDASWEDSAPYTYNGQDQSSTIKAHYLDINSNACYMKIVLSGAGDRFRDAGDYQAACEPLDNNYRITGETCTKAYTMQTNAYDCGSGTINVGSSSDMPAIIDEVVVESALGGAAASEDLTLAAEGSVLNASLTPSAFGDLKASGKDLAVVVGDGAAKIEFPSALLQNSVFDTGNPVNVVLEQLPVSAKAGLPDFAMPNGSMYQVDATDIAIRASVNVDGRPALAPGIIGSLNEAVKMTVAMDNSYNAGVEYLVLSYGDDGSQQDTTAAQAQYESGTLYATGTLMHLSTYVVSHQKVGGAGASLAATGDTGASLPWAVLLLASGGTLAATSLVLKRRSHNKG